MTGFLVVAGMVLLLAIALGPAHRRARTPWRPGFETRNDRDLARLQDELHAADSGPSVHGPRYPSVPFDAPRPASHTTDSTLAA